MNIKDLASTGGDVLYTAFPDGYKFSYRLLTFREYNHYSALINGGISSPFFVYEDVFSHCYLGSYESLSEKIPMGYFLTLGELIFELSGDRDGEKLLIDIANSREKYPADSLFEYMRAVILSAFPAYTLEDIESWSRNQYIRKFTIAENVLGKKDPQFKRLDLLEVYNQNFKKEEETKEKSDESMAQRMKNENQHMKEAVGHWGIQDAEGLYAKEQALSRDKLQKLDKIKR